MGNMAMKNEKNNKMALDDNALDQVCGGTSDVPTMNPEVLLSVHQWDDRDLPSRERTGSILTQNTPERPAQ